jgi:hypothetical protein
MDRLTTALRMSQEVGMSERTSAQLAPSHGADDNAYLSGNFAPMTSETTAFDLKVRCRIPDELEGRLLRIGPQAYHENCAGACPSRRFLRGRARLL